MPDIPVYVALGKNLRGLVTFHGFDQDPIGLGKDGKPLKPGFKRVQLADLFENGSTRDAHFACYAIEDADGNLLERIPRLRKDSLGAVLAAGWFVNCRLVGIDLDLKDLVGRPGVVEPPKLLWTELTTEEERIVWEKIEKARIRMREKGMPWNADYTTRGGFRFLHGLAEPVPAGPSYEGLVGRFLDAYTAVGLPVDRACKDWTRLFRAPRVTLESGLQTWEALWFTSNVQGEEDDLYAPTAADLVPAPSTPDVEFERVARRGAPDPIECQALAAGPAGEHAKAELADDALAPWIFEGLPLAFEGNRHTTLTRAVGSVVGSLHDKKWASPELVFALLLEPVERFTDNDGASWSSKLWEMATSFWDKDTQRKAQAALAPALVTAPTPHGFLRSVGTWILDQPDVPAVVEDLIYERELVMAYGAPGSGKTLVVLDAALSLALGLPTWAGYDLPEGGRQVVYVSAEGNRGMRHRIRAWAAKHGAGDVRDVLQRLERRLFLVQKPVGLLSDSDWQTFREELDADDLAPRLFVFDTLSRCIAGADENSAKDMTVAVERLGELARDTGAAVVVVHHSAKTGTTERGSSVWAGAVDVKFRVAQDAGRIVVDFDKMKDGELPTGGLAFRVEQVAIGSNAKGKPQTSAIARFEPARKDGVSPSMLNMLRGLAKLGGSETMATEPEWRKACGLPPSRGGRFAADVRRMVERGILAEPDTAQKAHRYSLAGYGWSLLHDGDS